MVEVEIVGVHLEIPTRVPVLMLKETEGDRVVPIFIGDAEAAAIQFALDGRTPPRPLTHDLMLNVIEKLGATLEGVVITEVTNQLFYAEMTVQTHGEQHEISCRPSDGVALAVRASVPVLVADEVMDEAGRVIDSDDDDNDEIVDEFRDFIDNVSPEDFAS